ncbi:hypothetical protein MUN82_07835 [Hymenobacter aerilatus]|uniref:Uncharacterized protein n=1 Tax=Hymenobacter aerilatus TaxID=2932251 RepID=A0A8T9SY49_9BACT|nr:hypothetical protein [Hymenobacter aerilatus]UOR06998.1 hypothetical protein MUN82_07835 [Hymenobacter aerilatus]
MLCTLLDTSCASPAPKEALAPPTIGPDSVVEVAAGAHYARSRTHKFFWGRHYRKEWATPVPVRVFNLSTVVPGGLTPVQAGGSFQTKNLRLVDRNGVEYVLRSVDKDATKALPPRLQNGPIGRLMKDQTSVIHPYGAFIVPVLAQAAGVYHTNPILGYLGDDPALGKFRKDYANALYLLEERPDGDQSTVRSFGQSAKVQSSRKVFTNLVASSRYHVDARQYLRSRLFDMWLGDWSRREDQWRWASFPTPDSTVRYQAIPRDRDHAFFKFDDGLMTHIIGWIKSNYQSFHKNIRLSDVEGLNRAARPMDKSLLVYLSAEDFRKVADSLRQRLTDDIIRRSLQVWPPEIYALSGEEFTEKLRHRRDQLPAVADKFYELLARDVEIPGTDEPERFVVEPAGAGQVRVRVYRATPNQSPTLIGQRVFNARDTRSIKLFGLGGNDVFEINGLPDARIAIHIYDGAGQDTIRQQQPQATTSNRIVMYNSNDGNTVEVGKAIKVQDYQPAANEFDGTGWLLRHRLY